MRDVIEDLLRKYYNIRMILKRTVITERRGRITINVYDDLAPNMWGMYEQGSINLQTGVGKLDTKGAEDIQEKERQRIAKQVFDITLTILEQQSREGRNVKKEWNEKYGKIPPKGSEGHMELINYALGALFHTEVLTPFEYDLMEPAFDEVGHMLYVKQLPKPKTDEVTEAIGHVVQEEKR